MTRQEFEKLYLQLYPQLLVYGRNLTSDEQLIEDVIQELFLNFWEKKPKAPNFRSLDSYLFISFRNNLIRKIKASRRNQDLGIEKLAANPTDPPISDLTNAREKQLSQLLQELAPRQREVIFLRYYKNKSYQEISDLLGISYQVARNFSYRAIRFLKKKMKNLHSLLLF